jgi:uracil-DNA glycosylase
VFAGLPRVGLILAVGGYAQGWHLPGRTRTSLTATVGAWREIMAETAGRGGPTVIPLPHPSWRNNGWIRRNPWFGAELLPVVRSLVAERLAAWRPG